MLSAGTQAWAAKTGSPNTSSWYTAKRNMAMADMCTVNEKVLSHTGLSALPSAGRKMVQFDRR